MDKINKKIIGICSVLVLSLLLAGCGSDIQKKISCYKEVLILCGTGNVSSYRTHGFEQRQCNGECIDTNMIP